MRAPGLAGELPDQATRHRVRGEGSKRHQRTNRHQRGPTSGHRRPAAPQIWDCRISGQRRRQIHGRLMDGAVVERALHLTCRRWMHTAEWPTRGEMSSVGSPASWSRCSPPLRRMRRPGSGHSARACRSPRTDTRSSPGLRERPSIFTKLPQQGHHRSLPLGAPVAVQAGTVASKRCCQATSLGNSFNGICVR